MWSYAFTTFLLLSVGYAVTRVVSRAYKENSEIKTAVKKQFAEFFEDTDPNKQEPAKYSKVHAEDDLKEKFVASKETADKKVWGPEDLESQQKQEEKLISLDSDSDAVEINLMDEDCKRSGQIDSSSKSAKVTSFFNDAETIKVVQDEVNAILNNG